MARGKAGELPSIPPPSGTSTVREAASARPQDRERAEEKSQGCVKCDRDTEAAGTPTLFAAAAAGLMVGLLGKGGRRMP